MTTSNITADTQITITATSMETSEASARVASKSLVAGDSVRVVDATGAELGSWAVDAPGQLGIGSLGEDVRGICLPADAVFA